MSASMFRCTYVDKSTGVCFIVKTTTNYVVKNLFSLKKFFFLLCFIFI